MIRWVSTGRLGELFPTLEANLEVGPASGQRTLLVLVGAYRPPLGGLGATIDHLVMHNVGTATARSFLSRLSAEIMAFHQVTARAEPELGLADPDET